MAGGIRSKKDYPHQAIYARSGLNSRLLTLTVTEHKL